MTFDDPRYDGMLALRQTLRSFFRSAGEDLSRRRRAALRIRGGMPARGHGVGGDSQILSLQFAQTSLFEGLPPDYHERLDEVMDNRLAVSSREKMMSGVRRWSAFCASKEWDALLVQFGLLCLVIYYGNHATRERD